MGSTFSFGYGYWADLAIVAVAGSSLVIGLTAVMALLGRSAVWQRTAWQTAAAVLVAWAVAECMGLAPAASALVRYGLVRPSVPAPLDSPLSTVQSTGPAEWLPPLAPLFFDFSEAAWPEAILAEPEVLATSPWACDAIDPAELAAGSWPGPHVWGAQLADVVAQAEPQRDAVPNTTPARVEKTPLSEPSRQFTSSSAEQLRAGGAEAPTRGEIGSPRGAANAASPGREAEVPRRIAGRGRPEASAMWWPGGLWLFGTAVVLVRVAWSRWNLRRFRSQYPVVSSPGWVQCIEGLRAELGLRRRVALLEVPGLDAPVAFGIWRPAIAVSPEFLQEPVTKERQCVLAHELAHLASADPFWQLLADVACALWWWQPLVWWARRRLRECSEAAADEASLLVPGGPVALATCLVALGRQTVERRLGWLGFRGTRFHSALGRRVERLLGLAGRAPNRPRPSRLRMAKLALVGVLVVVLVLSTAWARPQAALHKGDTIMNILRNGWRGSLAAMAVAAWLGPAAPSPAAEEKPPTEPKAPVVHAPPKPEALPGPELVQRDRPPPGPESRPPEARQRAERDARIRELTEVRNRLEREAHELERKLEEHREVPPEEARKTREALEHLRAKIRQVQEEIEGATRRVGPPPKGPGLFVPLPPEERERVERRLHELERHLQDLKEAGRHDEAERVRRELEEVRARLEPPPPGPAREFGPEERQRRIRHLHEAAENLRAAGLEWEAARMEMLAGRLARGGTIPAPGEPGARPAVRPPVVEMERALRELHEQMEQMRREMNELRELVRQARPPRPERDEPRPAPEGRRRPGAKDVPAPPEEPRRPVGEPPPPPKPESPRR